MSSNNPYDSSRRRNIAGSLYGSQRINPQGRSTFGYWVPLVLTVTVATAGLVAWIWSERSEDEDDDEGYAPGGNGQGGDYVYDQPGSQSQGQVPYAGPSETYASGSAYGPGTTVGDAQSVDTGLMARMSGAIRRTPSPGQVFDNARGMAVAGVAAAGAAIGLGAAEQRDQKRRVASGGREDGFSDHERWNEEAVSRREKESVRREKGKSAPSRKRTTVAIVLSAEDTLQHDDHDTFRTEHASILSHLPTQLDPSTTDLFILLYAPNLTNLPPLPNNSSSAAPPSQGSYFTSLQTQALTLVSHADQILPFTTPTGYIHILRHLSPEIVYLVDSSSLSGPVGKNVRDLNGWVGQTVLVVGDESGTGGLVDTETETEGEGDARGAARRGRGRKGREWWEESDLVGLGKGVEVVDIRRVEEDWSKRVGGRE